MEKWQNNKAWFLVLPAFIIVAFSGIIPLMTVVNYSLQDIFGPGNAVFVGTEWFKEMLSNYRLHDALWRQFLFSGLVLLIEIPLGIVIALAMPKRGWGVSASLVILALPLVIPWNVIGTIWIIFTRPDIGLFGVGINSLDLLEVPFDHTAKPLYAWITLLAMEVWHWGPPWWLCWLTPACGPFPRLITRQPKSTGPLPGPPSCIFNCRKCAASSPLRFYYVGWTVSSSMPSPLP